MNIHTWTRKIPGFSGISRVGNGSTGRGSWEILWRTDRGLHFETVSPQRGVVRVTGHGHHLPGKGMRGGAPDTQAPLDDGLVPAPPGAVAIDPLDRVSPR